MSVEIPAITYWVGNTSAIPLGILEFSADERYEAGSNRR
jgi:hypothetical protein